MKRQTIARTITLALLPIAVFVIAVLAVAGGLSAPSASASSLGPRQEIRQQQQQQSGKPVLTSLTVTASGTAQPLSPAFGSTVKYYTVVVSTPVTQITVAGARAAGDSVEADTAALTALYTSAGGDNWATNTNWATAEPIGTWFGVTTDSNGRVTGLNLRTNNLVGTLPDELGNFTGMLQIYLQDNGLTGPIPDLSSLTSLTHLEMARNQLSGSIPALVTLTSLQRIYLQDNGLTGTIPDLSGLTSLTHLDLARNGLSGSIPAPGALTSLQEIYLQDNDLSGPIPALSGLTSLTHLEMAPADPGPGRPHRPDAHLPARLCPQLVDFDPGPGRPHRPDAHLPARQRVDWVDPRPERPHLPDTPGPGS